MQRDGLRSRASPLAENLPAGDPGPFAGEADPTCGPCEVPARKEAGRDEREGAFECNICLDVATDPVVTQCGHLYCWPCIYKYVRRARDASDPTRLGFLGDRSPPPKIGGFFAPRPPTPTGRPAGRPAIRARRSARLANDPVNSRSIAAEPR